MLKVVLGSLNNIVRPYRNLHRAVLYFWVPSLFTSALFCFSGILLQTLLSWTETESTYMYTWSVRCFFFLPWALQWPMPFANDSLIIKFINTDCYVPVKEKVIIELFSYYLSCIFIAFESWNAGRVTDSTRLARDSWFYGSDSWFCFKIIYKSLGSGSIMYFQSYLGSAIPLCEMKPVCSKQNMNALRYVGPKSMQRCSLISVYVGVLCVHRRESNTEIELPQLGIVACAC